MVIYLLTPLVERISKVYFTRLAIFQLFHCFINKQSNLEDEQYFNKLNIWLLLNADVIVHTESLFVASLVLSH